MDKEDQGNARTRRAEIVALIGSDHLGTVVADIFLISHAGIARADKCLQAPMASKNPVVAVGQATTVKLATVIVITHGRYERDISHIEVAVMAVQAEEMTLERLAGPVTDFGLGEVMFQGHPVVEHPCVVSAPGVQAHMVREPELEAHIGRSGGPIKKVAL